jgi:hypothetical protein
MWHLRATWQVRTLPERLMEWLLLFIPLDVFEAGLRRFGFAAKQYALAGTVVALLALLAALGALALWRRWPARLLWGLGLSLWLLVMAGVLPLTGAGLFAVDLLQGTGAVVAGYLAVMLAYAGTLATARLLIDALGNRGPAVDTPPAASRGAPGALRGAAHAGLLAGSAGAVLACLPLAAQWSPRPALPLVEIPPAQEAAAPPAAETGPLPGVTPEVLGARAADTPSPGAVQPAAPPAGEPAGAAAIAAGASAPGPPAGAAAWQTADLDAVTNGNLSRAAELIALFGVPPVPSTVGDAPAGAGRAAAPWAAIGAVQEYTGTIERLLTYAPGGDAPWATSRRPLGEVLLAGAPEAGRLPVVCVTLTSTAGLREGEPARARGYLVGVAATESRADGRTGSTTGLVLVGELTRL